MAKEADDWLSCSEATTYIYKLIGKRILKADTVRRWMKTGKRSRSGRMIKLRSVKHAGWFVTRKKWVDDFLRKVYGSVLWVNADLEEMTLSGVPYEGNKDYRISRTH